MEASDYAEATASNISEASYSESLCLSVKEQYKVINRNQLTRVDLPMLRAGTSSIDCGISLMEEISDIEDEYESPFENRTKKERINAFLSNLKQNCKKSHSKIRNKISNMNSKIKTRMKNRNLSISRITSNCNSIGKSNTPTLLKLSSLNSSKIISTSRKVKVKTAMGRATDKVSYKINSGTSYLTKKCISFGNTIKSKVRYNYYKLRNIISDLFPRRKSKFILTFRKGSNEVHKAMNCEPINDSIFYNEMMYDSIEYMSRNVEEDLICSSDTNKVQNVSVEMETNIKNDEINEMIDEQNNNYSEASDPNQLTELSLSMSCNYTGNNEPDATPTTINSFPRLGSMDSTTCTIQNDTSSSASLSMISMERIFEQIESIYNEIVVLRKKKTENNTEDSKIETKNKVNFSEISDDEIFLSIKDLTNKFKNKDRLENIDKKTLFHYELSLSLIRQAFQYYEKKKNDYLIETLKGEENSKDPKRLSEQNNEQIRNFIIDAIDKLKISGHLNETKLRIVTN